IIETCGRACDGYEIGIWRQDDPDIETAPGEIGEIGGRGASLMLGYFGDQAATEAAFNAQGWVLTGDLGWLGESGYLARPGRKKEIITRGGRNIYPMRIEALAMQCDGVDKAAAFAIADARLGERACLAVVLRPADVLDPEALLRSLDRAGLPIHDMPEFILQLAEMPLTGGGKIIKQEFGRGRAEGRVSPMPVRFAVAAVQD